MFHGTRYSMYSVYSVVVLTELTMFCARSDVQMLRKPYTPIHKRARYFQPARHRQHCRYNVAGILQGALCVFYIAFYGVAWHGMRGSRPSLVNFSFLEHIKPHAKSHEDPLCRSGGDAIWTHTAINTKSQPSTIAS